MLDIKTKQVVKEAFETVYLCPACDFNSKSKSEVISHYINRHTFASTQLIDGASYFYFLDQKSFTEFLNESQSGRFTKPGWYTNVWLFDEYGETYRAFVHVAEYLDQLDNKVKEAEEELQDAKDNQTKVINNLKEAGII